MRAVAARALIREILQTGRVSYREHAEQRMAERGVDMQDVLNILRGGTVQEPELENDWWRYRVRTPKIIIVIEFLSQDRLRVVTAIRN